MALSGKGEQRVKMRPRFCFCLQISADAVVALAQEQHMSETEYL